MAGSTLSVACPTFNGMYVCEKDNGEWMTETFVSIQKHKRNEKKKKTILKIGSDFKQKVGVNGLKCNDSSFSIDLSDSETSVVKRFSVTLLADQTIEMKNTVISNPEKIAGIYRGQEKDKFICRELENISFGIGY